MCYRYVKLRHCAIIKSLMKFYPLKFKPVFHYRIWGGERLKTHFDKNYKEDSIGESWEISAVPGSETLVENGVYAGKTINELVTDYHEDFIGKSVYQKYKGEFPLLIKFIDAKKPLSIQVHPNDQLAKERHNSFGKNEMWYIMPSFEDATITVGFNQEIDKESYQEHLKNNTLTDVLNEIKVSEGDAFYIPTGRIHAIGKGVVLAEIQQSSDVTYRIYDYDRKDAVTGKKRQLHTDHALDAIDFELQDSYHTDYDRKINQTNELINTPFFNSNFLQVQGNLKRDYSHLDSFVIYMCVKGNGTLIYDGTSYKLGFGECLLLPAGLALVQLEATHMELLEIYM